MIEFSEALTQLRKISCIRQGEVHGNVPESLSSALEAFETWSFNMARMPSMKLWKVPQRGYQWCATTGDASILRGIKQLQNTFINALV